MTGITVIREKGKIIHLNRRAEWKRFSSQLLLNRGVMIKALAY